MNDPAPPEFPKPGALPRTQVPIYERDRNSIPPGVTMAHVAYRIAKDMPVNLSIVGSFTLAIIVFEHGNAGIALAAAVLAPFSKLIDGAIRGKPPEDA
jgi:hypothetical protein